MTASKKPDAAEVASMVMRELARRGGICERNELRDAVTQRVAPSWLSRESFKYTYHWAIVLLIALDELERVEPFGAEPNVEYRIQPGQDELSESLRRSRREELLAFFIEEERKRD